MGQKRAGQRASPATPAVSQFVFVSTVVSSHGLSIPSCFIDTIPEIGELETEILLVAEEWKLRLGRQLWGWVCGCVGVWVWVWV